MDSIPETADRMNDAGLSRAHCKHLADSAGLESAWHQKKVARLIKHFRKGLGVTANKKQVLLVARYFSDLMLQFSIAAT